MNEPLRLELPYPPSVNRYWRMVNGKMLISREGRAYADRVRCSVGGIAATTDSRLSVWVVVCPPDRRRRDLDNTLKATLDALTKAGVWVDDEQIDDLHIRRGEVVAGGLLSVEVREL